MVLGLLGTRMRDADMAIFMLLGNEILLFWFSKECWSYCHIIILHLIEMGIKLPTIWTRTCTISPHMREDSWAWGTNTLGFWWIKYVVGVPETGSVQEVLQWQTCTVRMMYGVIGAALTDANCDDHPLDYLAFFCLGQPTYPWKIHSHRYSVEEFDCISCPDTRIGVLVGPFSLFWNYCDTHAFCMAYYNKFSKNPDFQPKQAIHMQSQAYLSCDAFAKNACFLIQICKLFSGCIAILYVILQGKESLVLLMRRTPQNLETWRKGAITSLHKIGGDSWFMFTPSCWYVMMR